MKTKSIEKLREKLRDILRRGTKRQQNKLMKAYHGKRLNKWWAAYANAEGLTISQQKEFEGCSRHMKGGHRHNQWKNAMARTYEAHKAQCRENARKRRKYTKSTCNS